MTTGNATQSADDDTTVGPRTGEQSGELSILADTGHEKVPQLDRDAYHHRQIQGDRTDVEIVTRALELGTNVVLETAVDPTEIDLQTIDFERMQRYVFPRLTDGGDVEFAAVSLLVTLVEGFGSDRPAFVRHVVDLLVWAEYRSGEFDGFRGRVSVPLSERCGSVDEAEE
ncbi:MAG: hypothetical protein ABEJ26_12380 [Halosimplex sp.]